MLILSLEKTFYCLGNFNIDLFNIYVSDEIRRYASMLLGCNCWCLIHVPTRVTETSKILITNNKPRTVTAGELISDLSDHYGVLYLTAYRTHFFPKFWLKKSPCVLHGVCKVRDLS